jgi:AcrR family transcriptional regulator
MQQLDEKVALCHSPPCEAMLGRSVPHWHDCSVPGSTGGMPTAAEQFFREIPALLGALPPAPPPALDPLLDAAAVCFAKFGYRRTSVQDVAQELGVNRTTVYRQGGNIEQIATLVATRDLHRFINLLPSMLAGRAGVDAVIEGMVALISATRTHPVVAKLLSDEPDLVGSLFADYQPELLKQSTELVAGLLETAMTAGQLAERDPTAVAQWLMRIGTSVVIQEPPGDLRAFLAELLVPALSPSGAR